MTTPRRHPAVRASGTARQPSPPDSTPSMPLLARVVHAVTRAFTNGVTSPRARQTATLVGRADDLDDPTLLAENRALHITRSRHATAQTARSAVRRRQQAKRERQQRKAGRQSARR